MGKQFVIYILILLLIGCTSNDNHQEPLISDEQSVPITSSEPDDNDLSHQTDDLQPSETINNYKVLSTELPEMEKDQVLPVIEASGSPYDYQVVKSVLTHEQDLTVYYADSKKLLYGSTAFESFHPHVLAIYEYDFSSDSTRQLYAFLRLPNALAYHLFSGTPMIIISLGLISERTSRAILPITSRG